jgi:two-component system, sensor histidine kinase PdtaS
VKTLDILIQNLVSNRKSNIFLPFYKPVLFILLFFMHTMIAKSQQKNSDVNSLKAQIQSSTSDTIKARLQGELAWKIKFTNPDEAMALAEAEIVIGYKYNDFLKLADGYRMKGLQQVVSEKYIQGEASYDSCIKYADMAKSDYYKASCYSLWAGLYGDHSDFDKAISFYEKGMGFAKKSKDATIIATLSNNLAELYKKAGRKSTEVEAMFTQSLSSFIEAEQWITAAVVSANLAQEYADKQNIAKAKSEIQHSLSLLQKDTTDRFFAAQAYNSYATIYLQLGEISLGKKYALTSKAILEQLKVPDNLLLTIEILTKIFLAEKNYVVAEKYALQQLQLANQQQSKINKSNAYKALAEVAENKNDYKQSLTYFQLYKSWSDSVCNEKKQQSIADVEIKSLIAQKEFEAKFETAQKDKENKSLTTKNNSLQVQKWLAVLACVVLLGLGFLLFKANKKKQKINTQLSSEKKIVEQQANEKLVLINEIHHRVKNNLTMLRSLLFLQARASKEPETKKVLTEAQARIQSMALVHQNLYDGKNAAQLNLPHFIQELFSELSLSYFDKSKGIAIEVDGKCEDVDIEMAIPLALIMNELATNSFKYAFSNKEDGCIKAHITQEEKNLTILYSDNGIGLQHEFDLSKGGFGFKVLNILSQQLSATISYKKTIADSIFKIELPV